ncbi:hypothetical protein ACI8AA_14790 [Geodermatophilus sp. SYSU D01180]
MTSLTLVTVAVVVYGVFNARGYGRALALGAATPVGAAAVVGAIAVPTFYAVAVGAVIGVGLRLLRQGHRSGAVPSPVPASRPLVLLVVISVLITLVSPLLFDGLPVLNPAGGVGTLVAGVVTKSNLAQSVYLVLSVGVVAYLARSRWTGPEIVGTAACLTTMLSFWAWTHMAAGIPFPEGLFDNSPAFTFQNTLPGGAPRVRGIFSEPAGLAISCLVTIAYCASRMRHVRGPRSLGVLIIGGAALYLGSISTSTTFLVAGVMLAGLATVVHVASFVLGRGTLSTVVVAALCGAALTAVWLLPYIANTVGAEIEAKVGTSSYNDRSSADSRSYQLVMDTWGIGAGLGSNRGSSFAASLLSTVGIVGTALFVAAVVVLVRRTWKLVEVRPVIWALAATLTAKVVSGPDLSDPSGILWLSLGVLAHAALRDQGGGSTQAVLDHSRGSTTGSSPSRSTEE